MKKIFKSLARRLGLEIQRLPPAPSDAAFSGSVVPDCDLLALRSFADQAAEFAASSAKSGDLHSVLDRHFGGATGRSDDPH